MKTEALLEDGRHTMSDNLSEASSAEREHARIAAAAAALAVSSAADDHNKPSTPSNSDHFLSAAFHGNGLHQQEHEARVEALQVRNPAPHTNPLLHAFKHCSLFMLQTKK